MKILIDPEIVLENLKKITVELRFIYEQDSDSYTLEHITSDLFGEHSQSIKLPFDSHYLETEVLRVKFGEKSNYNTLSLYQLKHILNRMQNYIVDVCYNKISKDLMIAYLRRIKLLTDIIIDNQVIEVSTRNSVVLNHAGYSPELITSKENTFKKVLRDEILNTLIQPIQRWLINLMEIITYSTSVRACKKAIQEFTLIAPINKEERNSRVSYHYVILKERKLKHLPFLFEQLLYVKFISQKTSLEDFISVFEQPVLKKILWTGGVGALIWFIDALEKDRVIHPVDASNLTAHEIFTIEGKNVYESLNGGKSTKPSIKKKLVSEALSLFKQFED